MEDPDFSAAFAAATRIKINIESVIHNNGNAIRLLLAAFFSHGHVLLEDVPGTGKTTLSKVLAGSVEAEFKRVQFTSDMLPSDILGVSVYDQNSQNFSFRRGPIFTQILLGDEINRASPRTQSALLEAMAENQVSIEGETYPLDDIFFVLATQNPGQFHGTYPLPEAQMDRFALCFSLGYVSREDEMAILAAQRLAHPIEHLQTCATIEEVLNIHKAVRQVRISEELDGFIVDLVAATRKHKGLQMGASPRAAITLMKSAQALSLIDGSRIVRPEAIHELAVPVIAHRLSLDSEARFAGLQADEIVRDILQEVKLPT